MNDLPYSEINDARRALYAKTLDQCQAEIRHHIDRGDHNAVWEVICDGPDPSGRPRKLNPAAETSPRYALSSVERVNLSTELEAYAVGAGWDQSANRAYRDGLVRDIRARAAAVAGRKVAELHRGRGN